MSYAIKLLAQYETDMLRSKLRMFPAIIKAQKQKVREARETFNEKEAQRALLEADIMTDVAGETDPSTGKAKFSNDKTRQAEMLKRKQSDSAYMEVAKLVKKAEYLLNEAQDELDKLMDEFKSYRYIVALTAEELALLADSEQEEPLTYSQASCFNTPLASTKEPY